MRKVRIKNDELLNLIGQTIQDRTIASKEYPIKIKEKIILDEFDYSLETAIAFEDCIFTKRFTFYECKLAFGFSFERCYFFEGLTILNTEASKMLILMDCKVINNISIVDCNLHHFTSYSTTIDHLFISGSTITTIEIGGKDQSKVKELSILHNNILSKLQIANCRIERLSLSRLAEDTEVFNCTINSVILQKVRNKGDLKFQNCKAYPLKNMKSHFIANESNLGKAEFFQFDFSSFNEVNLVNSLLIDCLFVNTTWSDNINCFSGDQMDNYLNDRVTYKPFGKLSSKVFYRETKQQLRDKREVYRQIKYALGKQGDIVNEQMFHAMEMNTYNRILNPNSKNFATKIILWLSYISSNYGQSLTRPLLFLIVVNSILFSLLNFSNGLSFIPFSKITIADTLNTVANFFWYLNPFHKSEELKGLPLIIDIFIRIVSSYSIYNIIRATRRFIK